MDVESIAESINEGKKNSGGLKLNIGQTILVGLAFLTITLFWNVYDNLMPLFLKDFGLNKTLTGFIMALDNILALILLPFLGLWSDKFPEKLRSKFGRRMPFIVIGSVLAALMFLLVNFAHNERMLWLLLVSTAFLLVFMCLYRTPAVALMPDVTPKQVRSQGNAVINIMGVVGGLVALVLMNILLKYDKDAGVFTTDNWILISIISGIIILTTIIMIFTVKENRMVEKKFEILKKAGIEEDQTEETDKKEKVSAKQALVTLTKPQIKSLFFILGSVFLWYMAYNAVITWFSSFASDELNIEFTVPLMIANISAFILFIPASALGKRIGRKNTIIIGVLTMLAAFLAGTFILLFGNETMIKYGMYPIFFLVGAGWAIINVHSFVMSVEMASEKTTGAFTGLYYTFAMAAQVLTPVLSGALIDIVSFKILMPYASVFMALALVTMLFVRHGNASNKPILQDRPEAIMDTEESESGTDAGGK